MLRNTKSNKGGDRLSRFLNRMKLLMFHQRMPETYLHLVNTTLLQKRRQVGAHASFIEASTLQQVYSILNEKVSFNKFDEDVYYQLFYGIVLFAMWCDEYRMWKKSKEESAIRRNYNDDEESENEEDEDETEDGSQGKFLIFFIDLKIIDLSPKIKVMSLRKEIFPNSKLVLLTLQFY